MVANGLFKSLTVVVVIGLAGLIAFDVFKSHEPALQMTEPVSSLLDKIIISGDESSTNDGSGSPDVTDEASIDSGTEARPGSRLAVGILGSIPEAKQLHSIAEVPWLQSQADRAFNQSKSFACQLLVPDVAVKPLLTRPSSGRRGVMGRIPVVTIGLEVDEKSKSKLPQASRGAIQAYLRDHRLAIEPIVYQDADGQAYFGTDCRAAFYPVSNPTTTIKPEPMIEEAMGRFRALGVLDEGSATPGRTLVMAFRYVQKANDQITQLLPPKDVTELLFLHIASGEPGALPRLEVFATTNERQNLHRLITSSSTSEEPLPVISATIQFEKFILMGLYPASPIVTGVRQRSAGVMSIDTILKLTKFNVEADRLSFEQLLDQFATITNGT